MRHTLRDIVEAVLDGLLFVLVALVLMLGIVAAIVGMAKLAGAGEVCQPQHQHIPGPGGPSVTVYAPENTVIVGYCVKAGSAKQGDGPVYVHLDPGVSVVTITHPSGKDISHYTIIKEMKPSPTPSPTPTPDPTPTPTSEPTPTPTVQPTPTPQPSPSPEEPTTPTPAPTSTVRPDTTPTATPPPTASPTPERPRPTPSEECDMPTCLPATGAGRLVYILLLSGAGLVTVGLMLSAIGKRDRP